MEKIKVELYSYNSGAIYEKLLLSDEQVKLLLFLEDNDYLDADTRVRKIEEEIPYREI